MIKKATLIAASLLLTCGGCNQSAQIPFPAATSVRLFVEVGANDGVPIFNNPAGHILTASQRANFEAALHMVKAPDEMAACFIPHHFFRYYDKQGKQIGEFEVCFCCDGIEVSGAPTLVADPSQMLSADYAKVKDLVRDLGEPTDIDCSEN